MKIKKLQLKTFKRFDDLTIDLGDNPKKIIALTGPNGCGKSSIFDAFEEKLKDFRNSGGEDISFFSKSQFYSDDTPKKNYNKNQDILIETTAELTRISFYIRTAYRFTSKIQVDRIEAIQDVLQINDEPMSSIALDTRLQNNYKRLLGKAYDEFDIGIKTGEKVREELISSINKVLSEILDIKISSLGNVLKNKGQLFFQKGNVKDFPYANLSSGEKEVVDLVVDLIVKTPVFNDTIFCIDEPELHLNTAIQRKLLVEIEKLIPDNCQLWVATHSIGFLRALQEELREKAQILDFSEKDFFTGSKIITPIKLNRINWQRIFNTALEDLTGLMAPNKIIYCEGKVSVSDTEEKGLDAKVYNEIFAESNPDCLFVSSGGNTELDHRSEIAIAILGKVFSKIEIWVLKDRDFSSGNQTDETTRQLYLKNNLETHRILKRWEIENYLYDKEILKKYCEKNRLNFNETKYDGHVTDIINQNLKDCTGIIKTCCGISNSINAEIFKLNLAAFITPDTSTFTELQECIFERR